MKPHSASQVFFDTIYVDISENCGYCGQSKTLIESIFRVSDISSHDYIALLNRGWYRYGNYYYQPNVMECCCKLLAHRLDIKKFCMRKTQRKCLKRWANYLLGKNSKSEVYFHQALSKKNKHYDVHDSKQVIIEPSKKCSEARKLVQNLDENAQNQSGEDILNRALRKFLISLRVQRDKFKIIFDMGSEQEIVISDKYTTTLKVTKSNSKKYGEYSTNILLLLYLDNKEILKQIGITQISEFVEKMKPVVKKDLQSLIETASVNIQENGYLGFRSNKNKVNNNLKNTESKHENTMKKKKNSHSKWFHVVGARLCSFLLCCKGVGKNSNKVEERKVANAPSSTNKICAKKVKATNKENIIENKNTQTSGICKFEIKLEPAKFEQESYELYKKYCNDRHGGEGIEEDTYIDFICTQALKYEILRYKDKELLLGSYHMKYYLDGNLIALGAVDITPTCLQSIYFFYDPSYKHLSLGVIGVLKEIEFMQEKQKYFPEFQYYHLGAYVQSSKKMIYKRDYEPAELLCPYTYTWVKYDEKIKNKIDSNNLRLAEEDVQILEDMDFTNFDTKSFVLDNVNIYLGKPIKLKNIGEALEYIDQESLQKVFEIFIEISQKLGKKLTQSIEFKNRD